MGPSCIRYDIFFYNIHNISSDNGVSLILGLEHDEVFKLKDTERRVQGRILGQVDAYILAVTDEYILKGSLNTVRFGYELVFENNIPPPSSFLSNN